MAKPEVETLSRRQAQAGRKPQTQAAKAPSYLKKMDVAVREHFAEATDLSTFLTGEISDPLTAEERKLLVRQAMILIEQNYVHLPQKRAMYSIDPVQRLKLLLQELEQPIGSTTISSDVSFHREMTEIFTSLHDLHTNYLLPDPFRAKVAFLPFMIEDYMEAGQRKYLVSHITSGFKHPTFVEGVEVISWNGIPIERAILNNAQRFAGSNREAQHARGVSNLTTRALRITLPPDEGWVIVGYRTNSGKLAEVKINWLVNPPLPSGTGNIVDAAESFPEAAAFVGLDLEHHLVQEMRKALFAPKAVSAEMNVAEKIAEGTELGLSELETSMPTVFDARRVITTSGNFGYLRIRTFFANVADFIKEAIRLVSALPQNGLIIDVRGNPGGIIWNGEYILQLFTPRPIEPEPVQFLNTPMNLNICKKNVSPGLSMWVESMELALQTASVYSAAFPISNAGKCNEIGQKYFGPVVLIVDAQCYSTTDFFAAGFQDHEIGPILGTDGNTGAGGANVWDHSLLRQYLPGASSEYQQLPKGAGLRVAIRRCLRVGRRAGMPVEDLGVHPDERHFLTKADLLNNNIDLINKAGSMLAARQPSPSFKLSVEKVSPTQINAVAITECIDRLDVYIKDRPTQFLDVHSSRTDFTVTKPVEAPMTMEIKGYDDSKIVARYRIEI